MTAWPTSKLGELTTVISSGATPLGGSENYASSGEVIFIRSQNVRMNRLVLDDVAFITRSIDQQLARTRVQTGDTLLNITGASIGRVAVFGLEGVRANVNQHVCVIRPKPQCLSSNYLSRYIATPHFQSHINRIQAGGTRQALNFSQIADFDIPLPPLPEQRKIAAILDQADTLRLKRRQALAKLDNLTQSLFLETFGELRSMSHWPLLAISELIGGFDSGKSVVADDLEIKNGYRVLKVSAVGAAEFLPEENKPLPVGYIPQEKHFVHQGDLLFSRANTAELVGLTAYVWEEPTNIILPDKLWKFIWRDESEVCPLFIHQVFKQKKIRDEISRRATGTSGSMKNISQGKLMGIKVPVPPKDLQIKFSKTVMAFNKERLRLLHSRYSLDALFHSLQHRAFRGEL